jgi:Uma2 family endonuclease
MATLPRDAQIAESYISVREYLNTSYSPDCEYVDGRIVERNLGEKDHSLLTKYFTVLFASHEETWGVIVYPELRTQVAQTRYRVPDVLVVRAGVEFERILEAPPLIAIEILSPRDEWTDVLQKIDEYIAFGTENIWVVDPIRRRAWTANASGLQLIEGNAAATLTIPGTPIRVPLSEAFAKLDPA